MDSETVAQVKSEDQLKWKHPPIYRLRVIPANVILRDIDNVKKTDCEQIVWGGKNPIPEIGDRVEVLFNSFRFGTVVGYFVEYGYLGLHVDLDRLPRWAKRQWKDSPKPAVFPGNEIGIFGPEMRPLRKRKSR